MNTPTSAKAARVTDGLKAVADYLSMSEAHGEEVAAIYAAIKFIESIAPDAEPVALQTRLIEVLRHLTFPPEHNYRSPISMHPVWLENEWVNNAQDLLQEIDARALIAKLDAAPLPSKDAEPVAPTQGKPVKLTYTNWRGETALRHIHPLYMWFGSTEWHPDHQWLITARDLDKGVERDFALSGFAAPLPAKDAVGEAERLRKALEPFIRYGYYESSDCYVVRVVSRDMIEAKAAIAASSPPKDAQPIETWHDYVMDSIDPDEYTDPLDKDAQAVAKEGDRGT